MNSLHVNVDLMEDFNPQCPKKIIEKMRQFLLEQDASFMMDYSMKGLQKYLTEKDLSGVLDFSVLYQTGMFIVH
jgi:hypothetical protein